MDDNDKDEADGGGQEGGHSEEKDCPDTDRIALKRSCMMFFSYFSLMLLRSDHICFFSHIFMAGEEPHSNHPVHLCVEACRTGDQTEEKNTILSNLKYF